MAILTISREYGSGGKEIGRRVAQRLHYHLVDKKLLFQDLDRMGNRWGQVARELDEVSPNLWERHDWQYLGYIAQLESLIFDYAVADKAVIVGRGAFYVLRQVPHCLKVRVVAPLESRIEHIMVRDSLGRAAAEELIIRTDLDRAGYIKANYHINWDDQNSYDLVLNTVSLTYAQAVDILIEGLADKDKVATPKAKADLADMALAAHIRARVATDSRVLVPTLKVNLEEGEIVISGVIHSPRELELVRNLVRQVAGSRQIRFDLHHRG
jgi:cytidylate kinase